MPLRREREGVASPPRVEYSFLPALTDTRSWRGSGNGTGSSSGPRSGAGAGAEKHGAQVSSAG